MNTIPVLTDLTAKEVAYLIHFVSFLFQFQIVTCYKLIPEFHVYTLFGFLSL